MYIMRKCWIKQSPEKYNFKDTHVAINADDIMSQYTFKIIR